MWTRKIVPSCEGKPKNKAGRWCRECMWGEKKKAVNKADPLPVELVFIWRDNGGVFTHTQPGVTLCDPNRSGWVLSCCVEADNAAASDKLSCWSYRQGGAEVLNFDLGRTNNASGSLTQHFWAKGQKYFFFLIDLKIFEIVHLFKVVCISSSMFNPLIHRNLPRLLFTDIS